MVKLKNAVQENKKKIRKSTLIRLRSMDQAERKTRSHKIKRRLFKDRSFKRAESIMFYVSKSYEVDTSQMIEEALRSGKKVIIPMTDTQKKRLIPTQITDPKTQLAKGAFGVYEPKRKYLKPVDVKDIDMVVVPGIAFDKKGNRIGHGKGYFDRFLQSLPKKTPTIGLAFRCQLIERIKTLAWDISVTKLITA
jgi:5-formyltetrahydrofolate cyclo-ligase